MVLLSVRHQLNQCTSLASAQAPRIIAMFMELSWQGHTPRDGAKCTTTLVLVHHNEMMAFLRNFKALLIWSMCAHQSFHNSCLPRRTLGNSPPGNSPLGNEALFLAMLFVYDIRW